MMIFHCYVSSPEGILDLQLFSMLDQAYPEATRCQEPGRMEIQSLESIKTMVFLIFYDQKIESIIVYIYVTIKYS